MGPRDLVGSSWARRLITQSQRYFNVSVRILRCIVKIHLCDSFGIGYYSESPYFGTPFYICIVGHTLIWNFGIIPKCLDNLELKY